MQVQSCEQFGTERAQEIDSLIEAACGRPCPGRGGGRCYLEPPEPVADEDLTTRLRVIAS